MRKMQKEKQSIKKVHHHQNPQLPHDRLEKIHPQRQEDRRQNQVPLIVGHQEDIRGQLRIDQVQLDVGGRA